MNINRKNTLKLLSAVFFSFVTGAFAAWLVVNKNHVDAQNNADEKKPLYWVAPMDPNFKRDKPGKSPMGMDLVPVYEESAGEQNSGPGTIRVSPDVINNIGVRTGLVERKPLHSEIVTVGYVKYDENKLIHIHPRIAGWVEKLYVKALGDPVSAGAPLYSLYSPELVNAQEELLLAINRKSSRLVQAAEDRLRALQIPEEFIKNLMTSQKIKQTVTFYSPKDGVVDNLNIREGFYVQPGTSMFSIGSLEQVWVEAEIFERQASLVNQGDPVTMTLDYLPGRTWVGKVDYIYPTLDSKTRTVRLRLRFDNPNGELKPNMFAQVSVHTDSEENVLVIPREALIRTGSQDRVVLALGDGFFKSIAVKIGRSDQNMVEVLSGVKEGEAVVTSAQFLLDSESSKTSDFKRIHHGDTKPDSVWVAGQIQSVNIEERVLTASHEPIEAWDWPVMTMSFSVRSGVNIESLRAGVNLHMEITRRSENDYQITNIHIQKSDNQNQADTEHAEATGVINSISEQSRSMNISRGPIEKWGRPAATLDFNINPHIDVNSLNIGDKIKFLFEVKRGEFFIIKIFNVNGKEYNGAVLPPEGQNQNTIQQDQLEQRGQRNSMPSHGDHL